MKIKNEVKIGIMVVGCLVLLGYLTIKSGNFSLKKEGYHIKVQFKNIEGVNMNSPVMVNGYEVGIVEAVNIIDGEEEVIMELLVWLQDDVKIRQGAKGYIKNLGLMGEKYVGLTSGDRGAPYINDGDTINGQDPADFDKLIAEGRDIAVQLKEISTNINQRLQNNKENVDQILSNLNQTLGHLSSITANADQRMDVNKEKIDEIVENLSQLSKNLEELSYDLKLHPWKLLHKSKGQAVKEDK